MRKIICSGVAMLLLCGVALPVWADDEDDVAAAMNTWGDYLAKGTSEEPGEILTLYADDAVLWGTISTTRRDDPAAIRDYFINAYKALPELTVEFEDPNIRVYGGDTAVNTGYYTFSYEKDGATKSLPARYSFTLVKRDGGVADRRSPLVSNAATAPVAAPPARRREVTRLGASGTSRLGPAARPVIAGIAWILRERFR
jgi:hypothetical protein